MEKSGRTMLAKIWDQHVIARMSEDTDLLHVDRHLLHDLGGSRGLLDIKGRFTIAASMSTNNSSTDVYSRNLPCSMSSTPTWISRLRASILSLRSRRSRNPSRTTSFADL